MPYTGAVAEKLTDESTRHVLPHNLPTLRMCTFSGGQDTDARAVPDTTSISSGRQSLSPFESGLETRERFCCDTGTDCIIYRHDCPIQLNGKYFVREDARFRSLQRLVSAITLSPRATV